MLRARCVHLNWQAVIIILLALICKEVHHTETGNFSNLQGNDVNKTEHSVFVQNKKCQQEGIKCSELTYPCIECNLKNLSCRYGAEVNVLCWITGKTKCEGSKEFNKTMICRYCYQTNMNEHTCVMKSNCKAVSTPREYYQTNCSVNDDVICLGRRRFPKRVLCNWTSGYRWSTTLILSVTLGGFGADRFYLGHWQEGIGKLFSFGGLGVWTLIDVLLIALHYLGPADGSLYI